LGCPKKLFLKIFNCHSHDQKILVTQVSDQKLVIDFFGHCLKNIWALTKMFWVATKKKKVVGSIVQTTILF
jgi:hypothetical protein